MSRESPGGDREPVRHIVRIVVVPRAAGRKRQKDGHDHSHGLTDDELKTAQATLQEMDPPGDGTPARRGPGSKKPKSMFEALEPTDIVVVGREPASVRRVDRDGKPVANPNTEAGRSESKSTLKLSAHDDRNRDTVLRVWTESDTIEYVCAKPFEIVGVERAGWKIDGAPDDPFGNGAPYRAQRRPSARGQKPLWVWTSGLLPARANNQQYKMTFQIGGQKIDPDVVCGSPPPSP